MKPNIGCQLSATIPQTLPRCLRFARQCRGFTLIELLVVILIISIVSGVALLTIGHNDHKRMQSFANELTQALTLAEETAMLQPKVLGLSFSSNAFHFVSLQASANEKKASWLPLQDRILKDHDIPSDMALDVVVANAQAATDEEESEDANPKIVISTNGDITPFKIYVGKKGEKPSYVIVGDADGNVTNQALS